MVYVARLQHFYGGAMRPTGCLLNVHGCDNRNMVPYDLGCPMNAMAHTCVNVHGFCMFEC